MIKRRSNKLNKNLYTLYPGDFYATREDCVISTVVGQSLALCLYDERIQIGGMTVFVVPGTIDTNFYETDVVAGQAITSIEYLLADIIKLGGNRKFLKAKVFGSAYSSDLIEKDEVTRNNILFIEKYFDGEQVELVKKDLGGKFRRKILFYPQVGLSEIEKLNFNEENSEFIKLEKEYIERSIKSNQHTGKTILFE